MLWEQFWGWAIRRQGRKRFKGHRKFRRAFRLSCISKTVAVLMKNMWWKLQIFAIQFNWHFVLNYITFCQIHQQHEQHCKGNISKLVEEWVQAANWCHFYSFVIQWFTGLVITILFLIWLSKSSQMYIILLCFEF